MNRQQGVDSVVAPVRIVTQSPFPNDIFRPNSLHLAEDQPFFQIAIDIGDIVGDSAADSFLIRSRIKNLPVGVPIAQLFLEQTIDLLPMLVGHSCISVGGRIFVFMARVVLIFRSKARQFGGLVEELREQTVNLGQ
jgi:hypothetical protein